MPDGTTFDQSFPGFDFMPELLPLDVTTPPKTPVICSGPRLIPRVRMQDQIAEPTIGPIRHRSRSSVSSTGFPIHYNPYLPRPDTCRRSTSPATSFQLLTPVSDTSPCMPIRGAHLASALNFATTPSRPAMNHGRSISTSAVPTHTRNLSTSSIDGSVLNRYGYPTYRNLPQGVHLGNRPQTASALSHLIPIAVPGSPMSSAASHSRQASRQATPPTAPTPAPTNNLPTSQAAPSANTLTPSLVYDTSDLGPLETSTLESYLTTPNPSPSLVQRLLEPARGQSTHFWYDVRNLRHWNDFKPSTITSLPGLLPLLQCPIPTSALPTPRKPADLSPESQNQLHEILRDHFAVKVNAALKVALGDNALSMRSLHANSPTNTGRSSQPEFLSNYANDTERTFPSASSSTSFSAQDMQRGRVVGIVKCYEQWNSGMRSESPPQRVRYLSGLSCLHHFMREHGCRYGFIITEIELLCVRYGGDDTEGGVPNFGFLELSDPIRLSASSAPKAEGQDGGDAEALQMTAALALFYLHMLAKNQPLPGQFGWKLDIGGPAALTRQKHLPRDSWMSAPQQGEKREAKRNRGWVFPDEALSRRECGRGRRGR